MSTPLFTHWRHGSVSGVGEGCKAPVGGSFFSSSLSSSSSSPLPQVCDSEPVFCSFNAEIEAHLQHLHAQLRIGHKQYQGEIDRYLVACSAPRFQHLVLPRGRAPHYDNLPDFSYHALGILDPSKDNETGLQQLFLLLRQCTPLRRRTKRAQRELQWEPHSLQGMHQLVQCMQGTLLGLYPTCARAVAFVTRVQVYVFLRSLLVSPFKTLNVYLQRMRYILKICIMEHLCNTITDYHPGICHMLNKSGQQLQHFCHAVTTMCDIFRGDMNLHFSQHKCIVGTLLHLEKSAHSFFERCTRAYRGIITGQGPTFSSLDLFRRKGLVPAMSFIEGLNAVHRATNQYVFRLKKGFKNEELMDGVIKLRIPDVLLKEKIRTQSRFDAMRKGLKAAPPHASAEAAAQGPASDLAKKTTSADPSPPPLAAAAPNIKSNKTKSDATQQQQQQGEDGTPAKRDRLKNTCTVSSRLRQVVEQMLACEPEQYALAMQQTTIFAFKSQQSELVLSFLQEMRLENGALYQNKEALLQVISDAYDKTQALLVV